MDASQSELEFVFQQPVRELIAELERKIANRTAGRIRGLRVETDGDSVILCGRTSTYYVKQLATQIARDENAELPLQNTIEVI